MNRIALVEDHAKLAELVREALQRSGIDTDVFHSVDAAWVALREVDYRVLVIDRGLPDGDGLKLVTRLRAEKRAMPCLMLTARDALHDRVEGLEAGADDYLTKPFPMAELVARVRALMRRPATLQPLQPSFGDVHLDPALGRMACGDESVTLPPTEMRIMMCLVHHAGKTVRRRALEAAAWGFREAVTPNALDVALHRLRRKLHAIGSHAYIVNVRNQGYVLSDESTAS